MLQNVMRNRHHEWRTTAFFEDFSVIATLEVSPTFNTEAHETWEELVEQRQAKFLHKARQSDPSSFFVRALSQ